ncbi:hypothetical protein [Agrobacterium burrii]
MLSDIWDFLTSADNRATLSWLSGGVAAIAAALWTVFVYFRKNPGNPSSAPPPPAQVNISGNKNQVAGRDINKGAGGFLLLVILVFFLAVTLLLTSQFGDRIRRIVASPPSIPTMELALGCGENLSFADELQDNERQQLEKAWTVAETNTDQPVYLSVTIERDCNACACKRAQMKSDNADRSSRTQASIAKGSIFYDNETTDQRRERFTEQVPSMWIEGLHILAYAFDHWAVGLGVFLPRYQHLSDSQYRRAAYGYYTKFDGLFTARLYEQTGQVAVYYDVIQPSVAQLEQLACIRENRPRTVFNTLAFGC